MCPVRVGWHTEVQSWGGKGSCQREARTGFQKVGHQRLHRVSWLGVGRMSVASVSVCLSVCRLLSLHELVTLSPSTFPHTHPAFLPLLSCRFCLREWSGSWDLP